MTIFAVEQKGEPMRLIDADALITWFDDHYDDEQVTVGFVVGLIKDEPTIEPQRKRGKWIPCNERLPVVSYDILGNWSSEFVLLFFKDEHYDIGHFNPTGLFETFDINGCPLIVGTVKEASEERQVIAWMPLPEPYREVTD